MKRIELEYDEFFTQIGKHNRISDLPENIEFKVSPFLKILMPLMVIGAGLTAAIFLIIDKRLIEGILVFGTSIVLYLYVYFTDHKERDRKYVISKKGIKVDDTLFFWNKIDDLHLFAVKTRRGQLLSIRFIYDGINKDFQLDSMTISDGEIMQILYMYQRWWMKNTTNTC